GSPLYAPWETELAGLADWIDGHRRDYLEGLRPQLHASVAALLPELGEPDLRYRRGWSEEADLRGQLEAQRGRDLARGQGKLAALGCMLAQARLYAERHGDWPIICLDDLASELDEAHQTAVIAQLAESGAQ